MALFVNWVLMGSNSYYHSHVFKYKYSFNYLNLFIFCKGLRIFAMQAKYSMDIVVQNFVTRQGSLILSYTFWDENELRYKNSLHIFCNRSKVAPFFCQSSGFKYVNKKWPTSLVPQKETRTSFLRMNSFWYDNNFLLFSLPRSNRTYPVYTLRRKSSPYSPYCISLSQSAFCLYSACHKFCTFISLYNTSLKSMWNHLSCYIYKPVSRLLLRV